MSEKGNKDVVPIETGSPVVEACLDEFRLALEDQGIDDASDQIEAVRDAACRVVTDCVRVYSHKFGRGAVGKGATAKSRAKSPLATAAAIETGNTGLIYGRVQSGKTMATIASTVLAHANGFKVIVVLTSDNTLLRQQTVDRFKDHVVQGPRIESGDRLTGDLDRYARSISGRYERSGVVFITTKNSRNLDKLVRVLRASKACRYPALIIDDEADNASLDTNTRARAGGRQVAASRVFDAIGDLRRACPEHIYLQVTATPQSLLLQRLETPCRPVFAEILQPGTGYVGGDVFFDENRRYYRQVTQDDHRQLLDLVRSTVVGDPKVADAPVSLRESLADFMVGAAILESRAKRKHRTPYCFLAHVSTVKNHHRVLHQYVEQILIDVTTSLDDAGSAREKAARKMLQDAYDRLGTTCRKRPLFDEVLDWLERALDRATGHVVNAELGGEIRYDKGLNFLIGGNRLGRGLTIPNLLVTYYGRDPRTPMSDTVHQHARMFGYRHKTIEVSRFYSPVWLYMAFRQIVRSDALTREAIGTDPANMAAQPLWIGQGLQATRANVVDPTGIQAVPLRDNALHPPMIRYRERDVGAHVSAIDERIADLDDAVFHEVDGAFLEEVLGRIPSDPFPGWGWEDSRIQGLLQAVRNQLRITKASLWIKRRAANAKDGTGLKQKRAPDGEPQDAGFLDGAWRTLGRAEATRTGRPVLMLVKLDGNKERGWDGVPFYAPTLILPRLNYVMMFNRDA